MFVLEKESGDVVALTCGGVEIRISVAESGNGQFILTIDAPADARLVEIEPPIRSAAEKRSLRDNLRHELLLY